MSSRGGGGDRGRGGGGGRGGPPRGGPPGGGRGGGGPPRGGARGGPPRGGFGGGGRGGPPGGGSGFAQPAQPLNLPPAVVDPRLADKDINALVAGLSKVKIEGGGGELPVRPGYGTLGKVVKLRANYFPVKKYPSSVFEYSVEIIPGLKPRRLKRRLFELLEKSPQFSEHAPYTANDGSTKLVSVKKLPIEDNESLDVPIKLIDEDDNQASAAKAKTYTLSIKFVVKHDTATLKRYLNGEPELHDHDAGPVISALNIMFTKHAISTGGINVGTNRYFFAPKGNSSRLELDGNLVAYRGFFLSVRPTFKQLSMNLNVATTAFYKEGNLGEALDIFMRTTLGGNPTAFVKGLRVKTSHLGYTKTVQRVGRQNAKDLTFVHNEYGKISVEAYFKKQYKITLQRPKDPVVDIGSKAKPNWVPPELCHILPNQPYRGKLTGNQTRAMLDIACLPPSINQADIYRNGLPQMGLSPASDSLDKFGMSLGEQMAVVPGRILNPPKVLYGKKEMIIRDSAWNLRDVQFHKGAKVGNCFALAINERQGDFGDAADPEFKAIISGFTNMCGASGMNVKDAKWKHDVVRAPPRHQDPGRLRTIKEVQNKVMSLPGRPDLVFIILSNDDKVLYAALKTLFDVHLGVMNVCVISQKIRKEKGQLQYYANVALKVNIKLGGVNHILTGPAMTWLKQKTTMLMGADVTHPSPGSLKGTPSIAAVVASIDDSFAAYPASMQLQESKKEMITDLRDMTIERLKAYEKVNGKGKFPARIIMFRDGVSEGQFLTVLRSELPQVQEACSRVAQNYKPSISYIIAGKRHNTRFYPTDAEGTDERNNGNPKCGMVVDVGVTGVYTFDFFLQSHVGLKGHARPTHYTVITDENKFSADDLQRLCHELSHTFVRATRGVSLIPPAYYADLACERGRCYLFESLNADGGSTTGTMDSSKAEAAVFADAVKAWGQGPSVKVRDRMYYI